MLPELERLIRLQHLENATTAARDTIDAFPAKVEALHARMAAREAELAGAEERLAEHKSARQALEKEVAQVQTRLTRFKEQQMEVKTNREYHAVQVEIAGAETDVQRLEDQILEQMLEGDELSAHVDAAKKAVAAEKGAVAEEQAALERERAELETRVAQHTKARAALATDIAPQVMAMFETLARGRKGIAVSEARDGCCASCQVRLRPQLFNDVRRNSTLIQCESCQRILYFGVESGVTAQSS